MQSACSSEWRLRSIVSFGVRAPGSHASIKGTLAVGWYVKALSSRNGVAKAGRMSKGRENRKKSVKLQGTAARGSGRVIKKPWAK